MEAQFLIGFILVFVYSLLTIDATPYNRHQLSSCVGAEDGLYINSGSDCKSYTYCHQELAEVFRCFPGTIFSEKQGKCQQEDTVRCAPAYRQHAPNSAGGQVDSDEQIQNDLAMLKEKLEHERALKAEEEENKRQIKFRELRDLLDTLKTALDSDRSDEEGQRPPKQI